MKKVLTITFIVFVCLVCNMSAQTIPQINTPSLGIFAQIGTDTIDLANLNNHFCIPLLKKPSRGTNLSVDLCYDSSFWFPGVNGQGVTSWQFVPAMGWVFEPTPRIGWVDAVSTSVHCGSSSVPITTYSVYRDARDGNIIQPLNLTVGGCSQSPGGSIQATDGSGMLYQVDSSGVKLYPRGGGVIKPGWLTSTQGTFTDANGNIITTDNSSAPSFTDSLGMAALTYVSTVNTATTSTMTYKYTDSSGTVQNIIIKYTKATLQTNFGAAGIAEYPALAMFFLTSVVYPDGSSYQFSYEPTPGLGSGIFTGRIASVQLPTGSVINYAYIGGNNGIFASDGSTSGLTVTTTDGTWQYTRVQGTSFGEDGSLGTTTATDPANNQIVYSFSNNRATQIDAYAGSASTGTLLRSVINCYNGNTLNCPTARVSLPINEIFAATALDNGQQTAQAAFYNNVGVVTEIDSYGYGQGAPGTLQRRTLVSYAALGNNILDHPASLTVCSPSGTDSDCHGSGAQVAQTTYGYDESIVASTTGLPQHVAISGSRGNLTSIHRWLNTGNTTVNSTRTFDDAGNVLTVTDPGGHTTSLTYGACAGAFVTQANLPDTNSPNLAHHSTSATYDCNTGLKLTSVDQNGQITSFTYDSLLRPTQILFPPDVNGNHPKSTISYPSPNQTVMQRAIDSSRSTYSTVLRDGYGRTSRTAAANGESSPYDQQDFCYDSQGRLSFKAYRYQGPGFTAAKVCSGAGDSFSYDALGRLTQVTHSDGSTQTTTYTGRASRITDEGNGSYSVTRILQSDSLGRLTNVCEISGATLLGAGGMPADCGLDIADIGFSTSYGYDLLDNLTSIVQSSASRSFVYDSLSRLTSETTPEAGSVSYTYNADSLVLTRTRPQANQTNSAVTTITTYQYDALHRPTSHTYSGDFTNTPAPVFNYDETTVWGTTLTNTIGRISSETVGSPSWAGSIFSYDASGHAILNSQCTPNVCSTGNYGVAYQYDLLGDITSAGNGVGVTFSNSYNIAGRLTQMTSSLSDATHPATLLTNAHYSPSLNTDTLGNGLLESTGISPRGLLNSYLSKAPDVPGTASVTISGAERSTQIPQTAATAGTGSVIISGVLQSTQVQTQPGSPARVTVTLGGSNRNNSRIVCSGGTCRTVNFADSGTVSFTVTAGGTTVGPVQTTYGSTSTPASLAAGLYANFPANSVVSMSNPNGSATFVLTTTAVGPASNNATFSGRVATSCVNSSTVSCAGPGWTITPTQANFSGGQNATFTTVYDSGTCTITVNSDGDSTSWSGSGTTAAGIAAALQTNINSDGAASVSASLSNNTLTLTARTTGAATNYPLSSSCTFDSGHFSTASFTAAASGSALTGGVNAGYLTVYDTGTITLTIDSYSKTVSYGQNDTPASLAAAIASTMNYANDPNSPITATASGSTVSMASVAGGPNTNYVFTTSSSSSNTNFTGTSFSITPASSSMSEGAIGATRYSFNLTLAGDAQVTGANDLANGNWVFGYDQFNRLVSSNKNAGAQTFTYDYDRYANRWHQNAPQGGPAPQYIFDTNNHIVGSGVTYDALGNVLTDGLGNTFTWDAESRLITVKSGNTVVASYSYDAEGRRVHGPNGEYVYDLAGRAITQIALNGVWAYGEIYAGPRHLATYSGATTNFFHSDWVNTKRVMTAMDGTVSETCIGFPFGDFTSCTSNNWSFNGFMDYVHDPETNLEHSWFRQYSGTQGRWFTPDRIPPHVDPVTPQLFNRYALVGNNPETLSDRWGLRPDVRREVENTDNDWWCFCSTSAGDVIMGNDIFDAIAGTPGTYISYDFYGNMSWGVDIGLWQTTMATVDPIITNFHNDLGTDLPRPLDGFQVVIRDWGWTTEISGIIPDDIKLHQDLARAALTLQQVQQNGTPAEVAAAQETWGTLDDALSALSIRWKIVFGIPLDPDEIDFLNGKLH